MKVSIIIVNYFVTEKLIKCVVSIAKTISNFSYEIIVVDNSSEIKLEKQLKKYRQVIYIDPKKNLGFGAGCNLGASQAKGDYLFFLNPDTEIKDDAIEKLYKFIASGDKIGAVSPLLVDENLAPFKTQSKKELTPLSAIYSFSVLRKLFKSKSIYNDKDFLKWDKKSPLEVDTVPGAALMILKKLFNKVGGFDEQLFLYFEENDLSKRIKKLGLRLYVLPNTKVIHFVGQSTKNIQNSSRIFSQSRFYYLKKHFGFPKALVSEAIIRFDKYAFLLSMALVLGFILRVINISNSMSFIGDQGWFYISARDMILTGKIPLLGITSSHTWLHQGPLWTYFLTLPLILFNFNPLSGAYLTIFMGFLTIWLVYKLGCEMFSKNIAIIASLLYSVSPAIVFSDRMPYHTSPIPMFALLYFYSIFKWLNGDKRFFPLIFLFLAILYNLELATFSLGFIFILIFITGLIKKENWIKILLNKKIVFYSFVCLLIPMLPVIISDTNNGFKQTIIFVAWVIYKPFSLLLHGNLNTGSSLTILKFISDNITNIVFSSSSNLSLIVFFIAVIVLIVKIIKGNNKTYINLLLFLIVLLGGIIINKTPSGAYIPILFPFVIYLIAISIDFINRSKIVYLLFILVILLNLYSSISEDYKRTDFIDRLTAVQKIIDLTQNKKYNLIGKGDQSQFSSFTMNYRYLLWWKKHPVSDQAEKLKIYIEEKNGKILVLQN